MRKKTGMAAVLGCAVAMLAPAAAPAQCGTAVQCAVDRVEETVADVEQAVGQAAEDVQREVDETREAAEALVADAQSRATGTVLTCAIQGRYYDPPLFGNRIWASADCVRHSGSSPDPMVVKRGVLVLDFASVSNGPTGPVLSFPSSILGQLAVDGYASDITRLDNRGSAGGVSLHTGTYVPRNGDPSPGRTAAAAFHVLPAATLDPAGPGGYFINGTVILESVA